MIIKPEKSHDVPPANWRNRKVSDVIQFKSKVQTEPGLLMVNSQSQAESLREGGGASGVSSGI